MRRGEGMETSSGREKTIRIMESITRKTAEEEEEEENMNARKKPAAKAQIKEQPEKQTHL